MLHKDGLKELNTLEDILKIQTFSLLPKVFWKKRTGQFQITEA